MMRGWIFSNGFGSAPSSDVLDALDTPQAQHNYIGHSCMALGDILDALETPQVQLCREPWYALVIGLQEHSTTHACVCTQCIYARL